MGAKLALSAGNLPNVNGYDVLVLLENSAHCPWVHRRSSLNFVIKSQPKITEFIGAMVIVWANVFLLNRTLITFGPYVGILDPFIA